ncbi:hypothetical protein NKG94_50995 [Micromonospora sp. M12]
MNFENEFSYNVIQYTLVSHVLTLGYAVMAAGLVYFLATMSNIARGTGSPRSSPQWSWSRRSSNSGCCRSAGPRRSPGTEARSSTPTRCSPTATGT